MWYDVDEKAVGECEVGVFDLGADDFLYLAWGGLAGLHCHRLHLRFHDHTDI